MFNALQFKVSAVFIGFIVAFFCILVYHNLYSMDIIRTQVSETHMNMFALYGMKVDDSLDEVRNYLIRAARSDAENVNVAVFNSSVKDSAKYVTSMVKVQQKLGKDMLYYNIVDGFFVYSRPHDEIITFFADPDIREHSRRASLKQAMRSAPRHPGTGWQVDDAVGEHTLMYVVDIDDNSAIGALVSLKRLLALSESRPSADTVGMIVMSGDGEVLLSTGETVPAAEIAADMTARGLSGYGTFRSASGDTYLAVANQTVRANLIFVEVFDEQLLFQRLSTFRTMILLIPLGVAAALIVYFVFLQRILISPMSEIKRGINYVTMGHLDFRLQEKGTFEFRMIIRVFNHMVSQIHGLKINVYEERLNLKNEELLKKKAELNNLQLRINPHFYANSLNIIYNLAAVKDYKTVQNMAVLLSRYFRHMMQTKDDVVELSKEVDLVRDYLGIQKLRFTKRFEYELEVDELLLSRKLPSLVIQPFVENSIIHGFMGGGNVLRVRIAIRTSADEDGRCLDIAIRDNGKGFAADDVARYADDRDGTGSENGNGSGSASGGRPEGKHIGIANVRHRLHMIYGRLARVQLYNGDGGGAVVRIRIPLDADAGPPAQLPPPKGDTPCTP